jgi:hypothetical protein
MSAGAILLILVVLGLLVIGIGIGLGIMFAVPLVIGAVVLAIIVALVYGSPGSSGPATQTIGAGAVRSMPPTTRHPATAADLYSDAFRPRRR